MPVGGSAACVNLGLIPLLDADMQQLESASVCSRGFRAKKASKHALLATGVQLAVWALISMVDGRCHRTLLQRISVQAPDH